LPDAFQHRDDTQFRRAIPALGVFGFGGVRTRNKNRFQVFSQRQDIALIPQQDDRLVCSAQRNLEMLRIADDPIGIGRLWNMWLVEQSKPELHAKHIQNSRIENAHGKAAGFHHFT
jgi:hypothetical protein